MVWALLIGVRWCVRENSEKALGVYSCRLFGVFSMSLSIKLLNAVVNSGGITSYVKNKVTCVKQARGFLREITGSFGHTPIQPDNFFRLWQKNIKQWCH